MIVPLKLLGWVFEKVCRTILAHGCPLAYCALRRVYTHHWSFLQLSNPKSFKLESWVILDIFRYYCLKARYSKCSHTCSYPIVSRSHLCVSCGDVSGNFYCLKRIVFWPVYHLTTLKSYFMIRLMFYLI